MDDLYKKLTRMLGAAHKRLGRVCRFPPEMVSDLYVCIHDRKDTTRPSGFEHAYCRSWIDGWVRLWYFNNLPSQTEEKHLLTKTLVAPCDDEYLRLDEDEKWEIRDMLHELCDRHREIISLYFGIDDYACNLREIARRYNITPQRIAQIFPQALLAFATVAFRNRLIPGSVSDKQWRDIVYRMIADNLEKRKQPEDSSPYKSKPTRIPGPPRPAKPLHNKKYKREIERIEALLLWKRINNDSTAHIEETRLQKILEEYDHAKKTAALTHQR